jgi:adenylosuccinate lyase
MIPRYTRPRMGRIWEDDNRYSIWLQIEILACEAMNKLGVPPDADLNRIRKRAGFDTQRIMQIESGDNHDVIAFLTAVVKKVEPSARFIHRGMSREDAYRRVQWNALRCGKTQTDFRTVLQEDPVL